MKFKILIEEQNRLECLKTKDELTDYGLEILAELSQALQLLQTDVIKSVCEIEKEFEGCPLFKQYDNGCYGCKYRKQTVL